MGVLAVPNVCGADTMRTSNYSIKTVKIEVHQATADELRPGRWQTGPCSDPVLGNRFELSDHVAFRQAFRGQIAGIYRFSIRAPVSRRQRGQLGAPAKLVEIHHSRILTSRS
jgi:hypothetical protein